VSGHGAELARANAPVLALELDGINLPALLDELEQTLRDFAAPFEREPARWSRGPAGKWTAGQHVAHVGEVLAIGAEALERAADLLAAGTLGPRPWRDPIQWLFVRAATRKFPRGGKAPAGGVPGEAPDRPFALARLDQGARRHRALCNRLGVGHRDRLWIWNPYAPRLRWHYSFAEEVRVQTTHAKLHMRKALSA